MQEQTFTDIQPIQQTFTDITPIDALPKPGILDRTIPLTSYGNATLSGLQSIGRGVRGAVQGAAQMFDPRNLSTAEKSGQALGVPYPVTRAAQAIGGSAGQVPQVAGAIRDINKSPDPAGTYAAVGQETAGQGAGQALVALGTEGLVRGVASGVKAIPSASRAGAAFQEVKAAAANVPIDTAKVGNSALELYTQSERGATLPPAVRKLVNRMAKPDSPPMTYAEAKDFQSNISSLSANEKMNLKPNQVRLVGQLNSDLKAALQDAADTVGKGQKFAQAMKEYHAAMQLKGYTDAAISNAWKVALGALGAKEAARFLGIGQ